MTIKGDRAGNIRKLTEKENKSLAPKGGGVDESIPDAVNGVLASIGEIDSVAFRAFFGRRLAFYRESSRDAAERRSVADELHLAAETMETMRELRRKLRLPEMVQVRADEFLWDKARSNWQGMQLEISHLLLRAEAVLEHAMTEAATYKGRSGTKSASARDGLAVDTAAQLAKLLPPDTTKKRVAESAQKILEAAGVSVPKDLVEFQRLLREAGNN